MSYVAIAFKVAAVVAEEYAKREEVRQDDVRAKKVIQEVISAIDDAKEEIIDALNDLRIKELMGEVGGLAESLDDYLTITRTDSFLEEVLSRTGSVKGQFLQEVNEIDTNANLAIEAYPGFATVISMRILIFAEFKYKWGGSQSSINQEIKSEISEALTHGKKVEKAMRKSFGIGLAGRYDINTVELGSPVYVWGYKVHGNWTGAYGTKVEAKVARDKYENELLADTFLPQVLNELENGRQLVSS